MALLSGSGSVFLWLWHRLAAVAKIGPLPWKLPYAMGVDLERKKKIAILEKWITKFHNLRDEENKSLKIWGRERGRRNRKRGEREKGEETVIPYN